MENDPLRGICWKASGIQGQKVLCGCYPWMQCKSTNRHRKGGEIPIDKLKGKAPGARYPDKNKVEDYIVGSVSDKPVVANTDGFLDEEIPF